MSGSTTKAAPSERTFTSIKAAKSFIEERVGEWNIEIEQCISATQVWQGNRSQQIPEETQQIVQKIERFVRGGRMVSAAATAFPNGIRREDMAYLIPEVIAILKAMMDNPKRFDTALGVDYFKIFGLTREDVGEDFMAKAVERIREIIVEGNLSKALTRISNLELTKKEIKSIKPELLDGIRKFVNNYRTQETLELISKLKLTKELSALKPIIIARMEKNLKDENWEYAAQQASAFGITRDDMDPTMIQNLIKGIKYKVNRPEFSVGLVAETARVFGLRSKEVAPFKQNVLRMIMKSKLKNEIADIAEAAYVFRMTEQELSAALVTIRTKTLIRR